MATLDGIKDGIVGAYDEVSGIIGGNPAAAIGGAVVGSAVIGAVIGGAVASKKKASKARRKTGKRIKHTSRGWKQDRKRFNKSQKWEVAYRKKKHKSRSRKGIHYTKNGQPYILLKNGKARFIKGRRRG